VPATVAGVHEELVACAACHMEHEGAAKLSMVEDSVCVRCHGDLAAHRPAGLEPRIRPEGERIPSMADHAVDFAALAKPDPSALRFDHAAHMRAPVLGPSGDRVTLSCRDCHEDTPRPGRFSRSTPHEISSAGPVRAGLPPERKSPVRYALHCAQCHPLVVDERLAGDAQAFSGGVPHEAPTLVRSWLRGQLLAHAGGAVGSAPVAPPQPPRIALVAPSPPAIAPAPAGTPTTRIALVAPRESKVSRSAAGALLDGYRPPADPAARPAWVEAAVAAIESRLYASPDGTCLTCHPAPADAPGLAL
jgi:predicted CXXCH cytochrome family protein